MNKTLRWVSIICGILAILFLLTGIRQLVKEHNAGSEYETLHSEETPVTVVVTPTPSATPSATPMPTGNPLADNDGVFETREDIDFEALQERNPDVYAWIEVPGTKVDYPILQHADDNEYYLNHTIDHKKTIAASIYTENYNAKDFEDHHTVIYGHNMKNGSMFRTLHNFEDFDFFQENRDITIYMPDQTRRYKIFAAYTYDNRHLLFSYNWGTPEDFQEYIDDVMAIRDFGAYIDKDMDVTGDDYVITLSTCVNSGDSTKRYLVQAVLVSIDN